MPRNADEITRSIEQAIRPGFRGRLLARGLARNLIWSKGHIPEGQQRFEELLTSNLLSYGVGLFQLGLELRTQDRDNVTAINAFGRAGEAIESVVRDGDPEFIERGFYTVLAAAAYHLGHFSARAFSLFPSDIQKLNLSPAERSLTLLMRRDLTELRATLLRFAGPGGFDETLANKLGKIDNESAIEEGIYLTLESLYHKALAIFDFALEAGSADAVRAALELLDEGVAASAECGSVSFWWIFTITRHLLDDLWDQSLHVRLPNAPNDGPESQWNDLRQLFIAKLLKQNRAEIELWPSQVGAAARAIDMTDDLVAALPTSAGKTRIAEICILRALALGKRIIFVTPLRALSAQTERTLRQTVTPLGFSVSSLYGSSGATGDDVDSLRNRNVVVTTPEKLDFAMRNDPSLLDDVGLIVLDEAHTIGAGEREVRYEILVQRLLRRPDSHERRIVCLSAILPQGEQLRDFVSWIRQDQEGDAVTVNWRPTRQRFGEILWYGKRGAARLSFRGEWTDEDAPYVDNFVTTQAARGRQRNSLPRNRRDLCLMSAWRLVQEGQTVLLYCPERRSVIPLARDVLDLVSRGYLPSLLHCDPEHLTEALNIGREWLGDSHPAVQCLKVGVAVHHGQLPRPFLRAVERLLKDQCLKVTIASPTLAQGLNLSATTVMFCAAKRGRNSIKGEEFANVAGRAGRAFVDVEGQVLCAIWEREQFEQWERLLEEGRERDLKSGLLQLIVDFCNQIAVRKGLSFEQALEYITGNANVWKAPRPKILNTPEEKQEQEQFEKKWRADLASLDSALLSLVQNDVPLEELAPAIDEALRLSLWERSIQREKEITQKIAKALLQCRATFIWENSTPVQRKGYFFAGVSLTTGLYLDQHAEKLNSLLLAANEAFVALDIDAASHALSDFAEIVFDIEPFMPGDLPGDWKAILRAWVSGHGLSDLVGDKDQELQEFIEDALVYRLVWAMEAVRVRHNAIDENTEPDDAGRAALSVETGTPDFCAALLIQSGLASRIAAMKAVSDCPADFEDLRGLRRWARSKPVAAHQADPKWPTPETASLWRSFVEGLATDATVTWSIQKGDVKAKWYENPPPAGTVVRLVFDATNHNMRVLTPGLDPLGILPYTWSAEPRGVVLGEVSKSEDTLSLTYLGPNDFFSREK